MKLKIKQNKLMEYLNYVIRGISNKNLIPILNCILFNLEEEGLYLSSTDNDISIKVFIPKEEIESIDVLGDIVVSGRYIYEIIKRLPNEIINIEEVVDSKIQIYTKNSSFNLNCNNVKEFPVLEIENSKSLFTLTEKKFKEIVDQTSFAVGTEESRPALTGINFKIENNVLECIATDSYRLAKKTIRLDQKINELVNIIVPNRNINEIAKMLNNDNNNNIEIHVFANKIIFKFNNIIILSRLINANYPDTSKLIPTDFNVKMTVNLQDFYNSINRASLLTNEADKNTIKLENNGNDITLSSNIPEIGNVLEKLNVNKEGNENIKIAFSSKYMMDALKTINSLEVKLLFNGEIKPIILKDNDNDDLIQLILPIRTY